MTVDVERKGTHIGEGDHIRSFVGALVATQLHDVNVGIDLKGKLCKRKSIQCPSTQTHSSIQPTVPLG
jgi:hypothetical protein